MPQDTIGWSADNKSSGQGSHIKVIRREQPKSKGQKIMTIAEKIRPILMNMLSGVHDKHGMLYQPAHVRGIALNVAQDLLKLQEENE